MSDIFVLAHFLIHLPKIWLWDTQCVVYTDPTSLTYRHISFIHETCTLKCKPKQVVCSMSKYLLVELPYDRLISRILCIA